MTTDDKIRDQNLQYDISREAAKASALSSGKIDKHQYPTSDEILAPDQSRVIEQASSTKTKSNLGQVEKQLEALKVLNLDTQQLSIKAVIYENKLNLKIANELRNWRIGEMEEKLTGIKYSTKDIKAHDFEKRWKNKLAQKVREF